MRLILYLSSFSSFSCPKNGRNNLMGDQFRLGHLLSNVAFGDRCADQQLFMASMCHCYDVGIEVTPTGDYGVDVTPTGDPGVDVTPAGDPGGSRCTTGRWSCLARWADMIWNHLNRIYCESWSVSTKRSKTSCRIICSSFKFLFDWDIFQISKVMNL